MDIETNVVAVWMNYWTYVWTYQKGNSVFLCVYQLDTFQKTNHWRPNKKPAMQSHTPLHLLLAILLLWIVAIATASHLPSQAKTQGQLVKASEHWPEATALRSNRDIWKFVVYSSLFFTVGNQTKKKIILSLRASFTKSAFTIRPPASCHNNKNRELALFTPLVMCTAVAASFFFIWTFSFVPKNQLLIHRKFN